MPGKVRPTPVSLDTPRDQIVREVREKLQRFLADAARSSVKGGENVTQQYPMMTREIAGLAGRHEAIFSIKGDGNVSVNDAAAICYIGAQETILLRIIHRTGRDTWVRYEFAFCTQERGRVKTRWVDAKEYYKAQPAEAATDPTSSEPDPALMQSSAEELLKVLASGQRQFRARGAQLTGEEVEHQIKGLGRAVRFQIGNNAVNLPVGAYKAVCFTAGQAIKLRVFRRSTDGWLHGTFTLDITTAANAQRRARGATGGPRYRWRG
jgi:hypothetical protein